MSFYSSPLRSLVSSLFIGLTLLDMGVLDLAVSTPCCEEGQYSFFSERTPALSQASDNQPSSPLEARDHGCLCCCQHVVPGAFFCPVLLVTTAPVELALSLGSALADLPPPYHPPRA
jgi:hypothetical protein